MTQPRQKSSVIQSLSIRICTDGLSFCVYTPSEQQPYSFQQLEVKPIVSMAANLKSALNTVEALKQSYQRVNVLVSTPLFTTVPTAHFDREKIESTFNYVFYGQTSPTHPDDVRRLATEHISYNVLRRQGIAVIFGLDNAVYQLLHDEFAGARFYAAAATLIEQLSSASMVGKSRKMYAYLHDSEMTLYVFDQGRLLFVNTYTVRSLADCQYYLLGVWNTLGLNQLEDSIEILEDANRLGTDGSKVGSELVGRLSYFVRHTSLGERNEQQFAGIPYDLQTLLVCGF